MNTLKNNFDNTIRQKFGEALDVLEKTFQEFEIDYYLIGAFVREVWTDHIKTLPDKRATRDIDFAIYINEHEQYDKLKQHLIEKASFKEHKEPCLPSFQTLSIQRILQYCHLAAFCEYHSNDALFLPNQHEVHPFEKNEPGSLSSRKTSALSTKL